MILCDDIVAHDPFLSPICMELENDWTDFYEIQCGSYAIEGLSKCVLYNFLQLIQHDGCSMP